MLLQKHITAFKGYETPFHLYNSLDLTLSNTNKHELWLTEIWKVVSERNLNEEERIPSITALWRHWLRSCWVSQLWHNSSEEDVYLSLPLPEESGWNKSDDGYTFDWEAPEIQSRVQETIDFLMKGCSCKKGCRTANCCCRKKERYCGPACLCQECSNLETETPFTNRDDDEDTANSDSEEMKQKTVILIQLRGRDCNWGFSRCMCIRILPKPTYHIMTGMLIHT